MILIGSAAYPSYQVFLASGVAALLTGILMPPFIRLMKHEGLGQQVRADGPKRHLIKQGTPTMGGIIILAGIIITTILMAPGSPKLALAIFGMIATGALGLLDDIESVAHKRSLGLTPSQKMIGLTIICAIFGIVAVNVCGIAPTTVLRPSRASGSRTKTTSPAASNGESAFNPRGAATALRICCLRRGSERFAKRDA